MKKSISVERLKLVSLIIWVGIVMLFVMNANVARVEINSLQDYLSATFKLFF